MMRLAMLSLSALLLAGPAHAADLAAHSKIGRIFAEPAAPVRVVVVERRVEPMDFPVLSLPGYYGRPNSFRYTNDYGSSLIDIYGRLPYFCGLYGYC
jgi:hypothetical protein